MRPDTIQRLNQLNRSFYACHASSFDETRQGPWAGFGHLLEVLRRRGVRPLRVLDVGCGNGRFGQFLLERWPAPVDYTGIDQSTQLLGQARRRLQRWPGVRLRSADLVAGCWTEAQRFDLIVILGIMHHLPGLNTRHRLLRQAMANAARSATLTVTFWQFAHLPRFRRKLVPWPEGAHLTPGGLDPSDLETGDHLLRWGTEAVRYCHHASQQEMNRLVDSAAARVTDRFCLDASTGDLNRYVLLEPA